MDVALNPYAAALDQLFVRTGGAWKFGLGRTVALLEALGAPQERFAVLHVGGTNGKGSVVASLDALLRHAGFRVGRYTSPHLVDFRERIVADGVPIGEDEVVGFVTDWLPEVERLGATFFEATTAMAFAFFARAAVDVAVVEVGLGGRLDATNVVRPRVAAVTSIGLDHTQYLGDTREQIAAEKSGIFKPGVPAVIGEPDRHIRELLARLARDAGSEPLVVLADDLQVRDVRVDAGGTAFDTVDRAGRRRRLRTPLLGAHQAANAAIALAMLEHAGEPFARAAADPEPGLADVRLAGRFQRVGSLIFDVAHNPAGTAVVVETMRAVRPPRPLVALLGVLDDKDWRAMMDELAPEVDRFVLAQPPTAPASRAWRLEDARAFADSRGYSSEACADFDEALARARDGAATTLITGSFHTVGDAMARLQLNPLAG